MKKYTVNENYFQSLDSPEKAYILGFLYADGCNYIRHSNYEQYILQFSQIYYDKDIIYKINQALSSTYPVRVINRCEHDNYIVSIESKKLSEDLHKLGCIQRKSLVLKFPTFIHKELMPHFIRGYFDGDGCVWNGKRKKMIVKDNSRKEGYRERIIHNVKFHITGCYDFINGLQDFLVTELGFKKTKLNFSKAKETKHICTMEYSGRKQLKKFYDYIYQNATIYGERKKQKFEEIFCASDEKSSVETVLTEETAEMLIVNQASNVEEGSSTIPEMGVGSSDSKCTAPNE